MTDIGAWLSTPNFAAVEIAADAGYDTVLLDAEHGTFDLASLNTIVPFARALGLTVLVKAAAPERAPIQQALDFGADGIVIPHIKGADHARVVTNFAKLPPLGDRSLAGGRLMNYAGFDENWCAEQNRTTACYPMIEDPGACDEVEQILALATVDGIFVGPGDLFARRGSGGYRRVADDFVTMRVLARAARAAGKHWVLPAWGADEQRFAFDEGADTVLVLQEFTALRASFDSAHAAAQTLMHHPEEGR